MQQNKISDGQRTKVIYTLIKEAKYQDVKSMQFRPSTISAMSCSFVPEVGLCLCLPIATIWAKISWTLLESTNSCLNFTLKWPSINYTWPKVTTKMVIFSKHSKCLNQSTTQPINKKWSFSNHSYVTSRTRFSMPKLCSAKVFLYDMQPTNKIQTLLSTKDAFCTKRGNTSKLRRSLWTLWMRLAMTAKLHTILLYVTTNRNSSHPLSNTLLRSLKKEWESILNLELVHTLQILKLRV